MNNWHRNGETESPGIDGVYYFVGVLGWGDNHLDYEGWVSVDNDDIYLFGQDKYWRLSDSTGRWWGNLLAPMVDNA